MGIEPTNPSLARRFIGFEDRGRHQSDAHFRWRSYTGGAERQARGRVTRKRVPEVSLSATIDPPCERTI